MSLWRESFGCVVMLLSMANVIANPGDTIVKANFRKKDWKIYAPKGTGKSTGLEFDIGQGLIKLKDGGDFDWWFESPPGFITKDSALAYNGTIVFHLQSLEWSGQFKKGFDVVLVSKVKKNSVGMTAIRMDGDSSKEYSVRINENAGWQFVNPSSLKGDGTIHRDAVKLDLIQCLTSLESIRIRGNYYVGMEKTQLRALSIIQGPMAGDEKLGLTTGECCSSQQHACMSDQKFDLIFNNPGVPCTQMADLHWGQLSVGDASGSYGSVRLDPSASSPLHDFYVNKELYVSSSSSKGTIKNYLGVLSWEGSSGVSSVSIQNGGAGCQTGGFLSSVGGAGTGFEASFSVGIQLPAIQVVRGGAGCSGAIREDVTVVVSAGGVVTSLSLTNSVTSTSYLPNSVNPLGNQAVPAVIKCLYPCSGSGLSASCTVSDTGDVTAITLGSGGTGYSSTYLPTVSCAEGYITASDSSSGSGFGNRVEEIVTVVSLTSTDVGGIGTVSLNSGTAGSTALDTVGLVGTSYLHNALANISCVAPCYGSGLIVTCYTDLTTTSNVFNGDGNLRKVVVTNPGTGYSMLYPPKIRCPEGGRNFLGFFSTNGGAIETVLVATGQSGSGYGESVVLDVRPTVSTCISYQLTPVLSGSMHTITILKNGKDYKNPPTLTISGRGDGCTGFDLRAHIGDHTGDVLYANGNTLTAILGLSASKVDNYYYNWTVVMIGGNNDGQARRIINYVAGSRTVTVETAFGSSTTAGDGYALTSTPVRVLIDTVRVPAINFVSLTTGVLPSATTANSNLVVLASTASNRDNFYQGQTIYFMTPAYAAYITSYNGATKTATVAVAGTSVDGYDNRIPANTVLPINTPYAISLSYVASVQLSPTAVTTAGMSYIIRYEDTSAKEQAHAQARPFFCDQAVGYNPRAPWLSSPFQKTFAFQSAPLICSVATLTVAAEGQALSDNLWWQGNNFTVIGEKNEYLGTLFADSELYKTMEVGGPIYDSITISQEKMLEMTADRIFILQLKSQQSSQAAIRFRYMKLSFHPSACFLGKVTTDIYEVRDDVDPRIPAVYYNISFQTPPGDAGRPASDGVIALTADANFVNGFLELSYKDQVQERLFSEWVWGAFATSYAMSEPADVSTICAGSGQYPAFSCTATDSASLNGTRDGSHTTHHRINRQTLNFLRQNDTVRISFKVVNAKAAKLSPVLLGYSLMNCHMQSLSVKDGQIFGVSLFRPSIQRFQFLGDAPPAAGPAILWIKAIIKGAGVFDKQNLGLPNQSPRIVMTDKGQFDTITGNVLVQNQDLETSLTAARDPSLFYESSARRFPFSSALGLHAGVRGEFIDWLFASDFSQYDVTEGYVDSVSIPLSVMQGFSLTRRLEFTLDVPPGLDTIRVLSVVISYPIASDASK